MNGPPPDPPPTAGSSGSAWTAYSQQHGFSYPIHPLYAQHSAQYAANPSSAQSAWSYAAWQYPAQPGQTWPAPSSAPAHPVPSSQLIENPKGKTPTPSPSPPPPPPVPRNWHGVIRTFLSVTGLHQALRGLEMDILVLNEGFEREKVPGALEALRYGLERLQNQPEGYTDSLHLDDRKLDYVTARPTTQKQTPTSLTKSISTFLARSRARNDVSNRSEFLLTPAEKRARFAATNPDGTGSAVATCARTDARTVDRDVHMQFDIAKNDEGPLKKTLAENQPDKGRGKERNMNAVDVPPDIPTAERHPGADERIRNVEAHLAVKYVPAPPLSLLDRLKHIEDHIVQLEKDNPPWAALHFNQPRRGWPPPPRATPIVVDPRTTVSTVPLSTIEDDDMVSTSEAMPQPAKGKGKAKESSLHRAIVEKLEIQRAKAEIKTERMD